MIELTTSSTAVRPDEDAEDDEVEPVVDEVRNAFIIHRDDSNQIH